MKGGAKCLLLPFYVSGIILAEYDEDNLSKIQIKIG